MTDGIASLAQAVIDRIAIQTAKTDALELAVVQPGLGLRIDRYAQTIPKGDYLIASWTAKVTLPPFSLVGRGEAPVTNAGTPSPPTSWTQQTRWDWHTREVGDVQIEIQPELQAGDRVLIAWVNDNKDPIVLCKVVTS